MATDIIVQVVPGGLRAVNGVESDKLQDLIGKEVMAKIYQPRNLKFHRKYFGLLGVAREMADTDYNTEQFRAYVTIGAGYCEFIEKPDGSGVFAIPRSISFASMDEIEFNRLYQDSLTFICKTWVLDEDQLNQMVGFL